MLAPWTHPSSGTKYFDVFILLPTGISHNSQYSLSVEEDGMSLKFKLVWPRHFSSVSTLTKIARMHDHEVTEMHPLIGGITEAFKDLKASINDDISDEYRIDLHTQVMPRMVFLKAKTPQDSGGKELMSCIHLRLQGMTDNFANAVRDDGEIASMTI